MTLARWSVRMSITDFDDFGVTGSTSPGQLRSVLFSSMCCEHAQNVALPAFAAARRAAIDRDLLPTEPIAANPPHAAAAGE